MRLQVKLFPVYKKALFLGEYASANLARYFTASMRLIRVNFELLSALINGSTVAFVDFSEKMLSYVVPEINYVRINFLKNFLDINLLKSS